MRYFVQIQEVFQVLKFFRGAAQKLLEISIGVSKTNVKIFVVRLVVGIAG